MHTAGVKHWRSQEMCVCLLRSSLMMKGMEESVTPRSGCSSIHVPGPMTFHGILSLLCATVHSKAAG